MSLSPVITLDRKIVGQGFHVVVEYYVAEEGNLENDTVQ